MSILTSNHPDPNHRGGPVHRHNNESIIERGLQATHIGTWLQATPRDQPQYTPSFDQTVAGDIPQEGLGGAQAREIGTAQRGTRDKTLKEGHW
jgi:hypothetical protein